MPTVDYASRHILRMVHYDNLEHILRNGMHSRNSETIDPDYINIGDTNLIQQRNTHAVGINPPGGNLGDFVPFYFGGHSPMLYNIKTGYRGIEKRSQADIVFIACRISDIVERCQEWCFTDGHAKNCITTFYNTLDNLRHIDWQTVRMQMWKNCEDDWDRQRKKQAEFLVKHYVPVECIYVIVVRNAQRQTQVEAMLKRLGLNIKTHADTQNKFYYP